MTRRTIALAAGVLAALGPVATHPPRAQAAEGGIRIVEHPVDLRAGEEARIVAQLDGVAACRLVLRPLANGRATRSVPARTPDSRLSRISWGWRTPARTGPGAFQGRIYCWDAPLPDRLRLASRDHEMEFAGRLHGPGGRVQLVDSTGLSGTVVSRADARPWLQRAADWAALIGIAVGFIGLGGVVVGQLLQRRQQQSERTQRVLDRYAEDGFLEMWLRVQRLLSARDEAEAVEQIRRLEKAVASATKIKPYAPSGEEAPAELWSWEADKAANFFEEIAALSNAAKLDHRLVIGSFGPIVPQTLQAYWWWLHYRRGGRRAAARVPLVRASDWETDMYAELERMVRRLARRNPDVVDRALTSRKGHEDTKRALCLPREHNSADADEWETCKELSVAVGKLISQPGGALQLRQALDDRKLPERAESDSRSRTLLIPEWRTKLPEPVWVARAFLTMGARLAYRGSRPRRAIGGWIADRDPRVRHHKDLQETAELLDRLISRDKPAEALRWVAEHLCAAG